MSNMARDLRQDKDDALAALLAKKLPMIKHLAMSAICPGLDYDDAVQEGMIGFFAAVGSYDETKGANFSTYANVCIHNAIASAVRAASRQKHSPLNGSVPINDDIMYDNLFYTEHSQDGICVQSEITSHLTSLENKVLRLRVEGKSYADIAQSLNITTKSVDNALARIRRKLRSEL